MSNFWYVISQLKTTLYWNQNVSDRHGSTARKIRNHWISPTLVAKLVAMKMSGFGFGLFFYNDFGKKQNRYLVALVSLGITTTISFQLDLQFWL